MDTKKKEMEDIWYLLKCPEEKEKYFAEKYQQTYGTREVIFFQYQRMLRYRGEWHVETRALLPGYLYLLCDEGIAPPKDSLKPCGFPYIKKLCQLDNIVQMSKGVIQNGTLVVLNGPLEGREHLIQKIDRHKRTAKIEVPFLEKKICITVGLEIYTKENGIRTGTWAVEAKT